MGKNTESGFCQEGRAQLFGGQEQLCCLQQLLQQVVWHAQRHAQVGCVYHNDGMPRDMSHILSLMRIIQHVVGSAATWRVTLVGKSRASDMTCPGQRTQIDAHHCSHVLSDMECKVRHRLKTDNHHSSWGDLNMLTPSTVQPSMIWRDALYSLRA